MKKLTAEVARLKDLLVDIKKLAEMMESRDQELKSLLEHLTMRENDQDTRFETIESHITSLLRNNSGPSNPPLQVQNVKLDFPRFDGSDVLQWIFKAEQFFNYYHTPDEQRLIIVAVHLDKEVVPCFQMQSRDNAFPSWTTFTRVLKLEYGPSPYECARSDLFKLQQETMVQDYYVKFTALANRVQGVTMEALLDCFVGGLKPNIKRDVIAQNSVILLRCVSLAKLYEEKYSYKVRNYHTNFNHNQPTSPYTYQKPNPTTNQNVSQSLKSSSLPPLLPSPPTSSQIKKMSAAEM